MNLRLCRFQKENKPFQAVNRKNNFCVVLDSLNGGDLRVHSEEITLWQTDRIIQCEGNQTQLVQ